MMTSIDGRIDCDMTAQLSGNDVYYSALSAINCPNRLSGRVTAQLELADGKFMVKDKMPFGRETFSNNNPSPAYNAVVDTHGSLLWHDEAGSDWPHLVITSENITKEYLDYLDSKHIPWIATGKDRINLKRAMEILVDDFGVKRLAVVGGGHIDGSMLAEGLIDEISIVLGAGVDGRAGQPAVFDGLNKSSKPISVKLKDVKKYDNGTIWLRYKTNNQTLR